MLIFVLISNLFIFLVLSIIDLMDDIIVNEGNRVELICLVIGILKFIVEWYYFGSYYFG